jgi:hypothetical protein
MNNKRKMKKKKKKNKVWHLPQGSGPDHQPHDSILGMLQALPFHLFFSKLWTLYADHPESKAQPPVYP